MPLARVRVAGQGKRGARPMGPYAPGGGKVPRPRSRLRLQMGPEPALGLAIRAAAVVL